MAQFNTKTYASTLNLQVKGTNTDLAFLPVEIPATAPAFLNITSTVMAYPTFVNISKTGFSTAQGDWSKFNFYETSTTNIGIRSSLQSLADSVKIATYDKLMRVRDARYPSWIPNADGLVTTGNLYVHDANSGYIAPTTSQQEFVSPGIHAWVCPTGVTSVCVVAVGGGGGSTATGGSGGAGGGGGGLGYINNLAVVPGTSYQVVVGNGGNTSGSDGGDSYFANTSTVAGLGGTGASGLNGGLGGGYVGDGGGNGGDSKNASASDSTGGGGAGGYSGDGGDAGNIDSNNAQSGSGGGGGGGGAGGSQDAAGAGGGVGIYGEGTSGAGGSYAGSNASSGFGGSGGENGSVSPGSVSTPSTGGNYGGGGGGAELNNENGPGGQGAVRIIYGAGRAFPSTNTEGDHVELLPSAGSWSSIVAENIGIANPTTVAPTDYFDISTTTLKVGTEISGLSYVSANTSIGTQGNISGTRDIAIGRSGIIKAVRNAGAFNPSYSSSVTKQINITNLAPSVGVFVKDGITTYETITDENNPTILDVVYVEVDNGGGGEVVVSGPTQYWS